MKSLAWNAVSAGVLMLSLVGCVNVKMDRDYPAQRRYFVLEAAGGRMAPQGNGAGVLKLAHVSVAPPYGGKGFVYRIAAQNFETDFYNQFLVAPGSMVAEELLEALRRGSMFHYVLNSGSAAQATHFLEARVEELYGDFRNDGAGNAVLAMSFVISRAPAAAPQVVFQKQYERTVPLQARSADALVQGWNRALEEILDALIADLRMSKQLISP
jgi:uncharacterized lipoprotein YmbA